jgi:hypothetical protein
MLPTSEFVELSVLISGSTCTENSRGALAIEKTLDRGVCSIVIAVGTIGRARRTVTLPLLPGNAQQFPGAMSGVNAMDGRLGRAGM